MKLSQLKTLDMLISEQKNIKTSFGNRELKLTNWIDLQATLDRQREIYLKIGLNTNRDDRTIAKNSIEDLVENSKVGLEEALRTMNMLSQKVILDEALLKMKFNQLCLLMFSVFTFEENEIKVLRNKDYSQVLISDIAKIIIYRQNRGLTEDYMPSMKDPNYIAAMDIYNSEIMEKERKLISKDDFFEEERYYDLSKKGENIEIKIKDLNNKIDNLNKIVEQYKINSEIELDIFKDKKDKENQTALRRNQIEIETLSKDLESQKIKIVEFEKENQSKLTELLRKKEEDFENIESAYSEKLATEAAVRYWKTMAEGYKKSYKACIGWSIGTGLGLLGITVLYIYLFGGLENVGNNFLKSFFITALIAIILYLIKTFIKTALSSKHLQNEASERRVLTLYYLALKKRGQLVMDGNERIIILTALFSRSDSGLMKHADNNIDISGVLNNLLKK